MKDRSYPKGHFFGIGIIIGLIGGIIFGLIIKQLAIGQIIGLGLGMLFGSLAESNYNPTPRELTSTERRQRKSGTWLGFSLLFIGSILLVYLSSSNNIPAGITDTENINVDYSDINIRSGDDVGNELSFDMTLLQLYCEDQNGTWLAEYDECEYVGENWCVEQGGQFRECESACRHDDEAVVCTLQCVPVCSFDYDLVDEEEDK